MHRQGNLSPSAPYKIRPNIFPTFLHSITEIHRQPNKERESETTMRTQLPSLLLLVALLSAVTLQSHAQKGAPHPPQTGEWTRIKKVEEYHVQEIARFAVWQHNKLTGEDLEYVRIYRGYVDGPFYKLLIQATDDVKARRYEAVVRDRLWNKRRELIYFRRSS